MQKSKAQLLQEFTEMADLETQARDMYARTSTDPAVTNATFRRVFQTISKEEEAHMKIVGQILQIIKNSL